MPTQTIEAPTRKSVTAAIKSFAQDAVKAYNAGDYNRSEDDHTKADAAAASVGMTAEEEWKIANAVFQKELGSTMGLVGDDAPSAGIDLDEELQSLLDECYGDED